MYSKQTIRRFSFVAAWAATFLSATPAWSQRAPAGIQSAEDKIRGGGDDDSPPKVLRLPGFGVDRPIFPEERMPETDPDDPWKPGFAVHGYLRAPLRLTVEERDVVEEGQSESNVREPWLIDDDFFRSGFSYTPVNESDFAEIYFMAGNEHLSGNVALMASLFSDSARVMLDRQLGIAQAWLGLREEIDIGFATIRLSAKGGSFWDRLGWLPKYDTYLFGRTHQVGEQTRAEIDVYDFTFSVAQGFGAHLDAIEANQGFSPLAYFRAGAAWDRRVELGFYYLSTWTQDQRQLSDIRDAHLNVVGVDLRGDGGFLGSGYLGISSVSAEKASFLSPSVELMHSFGGRGITENYLGTESSNDGTGSLFNVGYQYDYSVKKMLKAFRPDAKFLLNGDVTISAFGLYSRVGSDQKNPDPAVNRDDRRYFKQGYELSWWVLPWIGPSFRYDRVVPDLDDSPASFRILSPRLQIRGRRYGIEGLLFYQLAHYEYGERVGLRPGQIPNETLPDNNIHKIQAQFAF